MRCACKVTIKFRQRAQNGPSFQGRRLLFRRKRHGGEETDGRAEHVPGQVGTRFPTGWEQDSRPPVPEFPAAGTRVPGSPRRIRPMHRPGIRLTQRTRRGHGERGSSGAERKGGLEGKREGRESRFLSLPIHSAEDRDLQGAEQVRRRKTQPPLKNGPIGTAFTGNDHLGSK